MVLIICSISGGPHGALDIGNFRVDVSSLEVTPDSIEIASGSSTTLLLKLIMMHQMEA